MIINFDTGNSNKLFDYEIEQAINWLLKIRDEQSNGWAWVQYIKPNEQNTAEVISALLSNLDYLKADTYNIMADAIKKWLLEPSKNAKITIDWIWILIALQKVRKNEELLKIIEIEKIDKSIKECSIWLIENQNSDGGWSDIKGEISSTSRTALVTMGLAQLQKNENVKLKFAMDRGIKWILNNQNSDGGWGNLKEKDIDKNFQKLTNLPYSDIKYQCNSNPACTAYALLAIKEMFKAQYTGVQNQALKYIKHSQNNLGGWEVFSEVGIRDGIKYTYRHFSTAWVLQAILYSELIEYTDDCIVNGVNYLIKLQDNFYGGWKSSTDADSYTWATCNALETINLIKSQLAEVKAKQFLQIICDWWELKKKESNFSVKIRECIFAFNAPTCLLFCLCFTIMMLILISDVFDVFPNILSLLKITSSNVTRIMNSIIILLGSIVIGIPWVVFVKNVFNKDINGWINSIGWVYGIITGFLLAYYQLIQ